MATNNVILSLALRGFEEQYSSEQFHQGIQDILDAGVEQDQIAEALDFLEFPNCPSPILQVIGEICMMLFLAIEETEAAGVIDMEAAALLSQRPDPLSQLLACINYERARLRFEKGSEQYIACLTKEAHIRGNLAGEWAEVLPHCEISVRLWEEAREYLVSSSVDYAVAAGSESLARIRLAENETLPIENYNRAIELARQAQQVLNMPAPTGNFYLAQLTEATALIGLSICGIDITSNLKRALKIIQVCLPHLPPSSVAWGQAVLSEANSRRILAREGIDPENNGQRACELYDQLLADTDEGISGHLVFGQAEAYFALAEAGLAKESNFKEAISRYTAARQFLSPNEDAFRIALRQERVARYALADIGVDLQANLEEAIVICRQLRQGLSSESRDYCRELVSEADGIRQLAEYASAPIAKLRASVEMFTQARVWLDPSLQEYQFAVIHEACARLRLAQQGVRPEANLETGLDLCQQARRLGDRSRYIGISFMCEANCRTAFAELGQRPLENLEMALPLFQEARKNLTQSNDIGLCLQNEGIALVTLARFGITPTYNLRQAVSLLQQARKLLVLQTTALAYAEFDEAIARMQLADLGIEPTENLYYVIQLCRESRFQLSPTGHGLGKSFLLEGSALQNLARLGIDSFANLRTSLEKFIEAGKTLETGSPDFARSLIMEADSLHQLADLGFDPEICLSSVIKVCRLVRKHMPRVTPFYGASLIQEGLALWTMSRSEKDSEPLLRDAMQSFQEAREHYSQQHLTQPLLDTYEAGVVLDLTELGHMPAEGASLGFKLCERASLIFEEGSHQWSTAKRLQARALRQLGKIDEAYQGLRAGITVIESMRSQMRRETERINFLETMSSEYAEMVSICIDLAERAVPAQEQEKWRWEAWHWVHRGKSRALLELMANPPPAVQDGDIEGWRIMEQLSAQLDQRDREIRYLQRLLEEDSEETRGNNSSKEIRQVELERLRLEYKNMRDDVRKQEQEFLSSLQGDNSLQARDVAPPEEVARDLRILSGTDRDPALRPLLVELFRVNHDEVIVFLIPLWETCVPRIIRIATASGELGQMVALLEQANASRREVSRESRAASAKQFEALQTQMATLVQPWASFLEQWQPTQLIFSPHFLFNLLPLHMASWQEGCLIDKYPVSYLPSSALVKDLAKKVKPFRPEALLLGNPLTGQAGIDRDVMHLSGAEAEVKAIAAVFQRKNILTHLLLREQATTSLVEATASSCSVIHLACHSVLDRIEFLRSGMELSDRRLTVSDVLWHLKLPNAVLVYLSSCEGAAAVPGQTDELMALARAFFQAGSPTVIASLWEVDDEAGSVFAVSFYRYWIEEKKSLAVAFQHAMLETRELFPSPAAWAPFVLLGAWWASDL